MAQNDDEYNSGDSEHDEDEVMQDAGEDDVDGDNGDDNDDNDEDDDAEDNYDDTPTRPRSRYDNRNVKSKSPLAGRDDTRIHLDRPRVSTIEREVILEPRGAAPATPVGYRPSIRFDALGAATYDIVPTIAAPHSTSINTVTATPDMRWVFSGGSDGWVRKFNWVDTANGKSMLTVAQRHPFVDSVTKAGVLMSYWENEDILDKSADEGTPLSPVYSLAVHHEALWLLSGTESGPINLMSVRHEEGKRITSLQKHTSAVSVLALSNDEQSVLSGSWDRTILDWDLNTAQVKRSFVGSGSQISAIEMRPISHLPIPRTIDEPPAVISNETLSSNLEPRPALAQERKVETRPEGKSGNSPGDSLFGDNEDNDSLFGDDNAATNVDFSMTQLEDGPSGEDTMPNLNDNFTGENTTFTQDENDMFAKALTEDMQKQSQQLDNNEDADYTMNDTTFMTDGADFPDLNADQSTFVPDESQDAVLPEASKDIPLPEDNIKLPEMAAVNDEAHVELTPESESTFLDASIDGTIRIWDRRAPNPVARTSPPKSVPPWCMHACWSPDGNFIYAGRRNGTVDEYSVHRGFSQPRRSLRFPGGSGAVSAMRAMPNGRHLLCASHDILRLYDLRDEENPKPSTVPFLIVPGHRTGVISQLYLDPTCTFLISTGGNRGWEGNSTEVLLGYEIGFGR